MHLASAKNPGQSREKQHNRVSFPGVIMPPFDDIFMT